MCRRCATRRSQPHQLPLGSVCGPAEFQRAQLPLRAGASQVTFATSATRRSASVGPPVQRNAPSPPPTDLILKIGTPLECIELLVQSVDAARAQVSICAFTFDLCGAWEALFDSLVRARRRGVSVRIIVDRSWALGTRMRNLRPRLLQLQSAGVLVVNQLVKEPVLHFKGLLADAIATFGSANWTENTLTQTERIIVVRLTPATAVRERRVYDDIFAASEVWRCERSSPSPASRQSTVLALEQSGTNL